MATQTPAQTLPPDTPPAPQAPDAPGTQIVELDMLHVTGLREKGFVPKNSAAGTKTITPLLEAPQSISVITADQMAAQGAQGIDDAVRYSTGIVSAAYGFDPRSDWLLIRGFDPTRYIDGLATPDGVWTGATRWETHGFERVEVLKGAASALYGQMPPGGLINATTKRPVSAPLAELAVRYGSYETLETTLDLGGPLTRDGALLYRLTGLARAGDTIVDYSRDDRWFIAPALTWIITPDTWLTLLARYQRARANGIGGGFLPTQGTLTHNPNGPIPIERFTGEPAFDRYDKDLWSLGYDAEHRLTPAWTLRQNLRLQGAKVIHDVVGANGFVPDPLTGLPADYRTLSRYTYTPHEKSTALAIDTQLTGKFATPLPLATRPLAITHEILAGLDYRHGKNDYTSGYDGGAETGWGSTPTLDLYDPRYGARIDTPAISTHTIPTQNQYGLYLQDRIKIARRLIITLGARRDWVRTRTEAPLDATTEHQTDGKLTTRAGLTYVFDNGLAPYAAWSTSFQPVIGKDSHGDLLRPTRGEIHELGLKYQPRRIDALITLAAYTSTLRDIQTQDEQTFLTEQQGKTRVRGLELEARLTPHAGLDLIAALTHTDSEIVQTNYAQALGKRIPLLARNKISLWAGYAPRGGALRGLGIGAGLRHESASYGDSANQWRTPGYTLWDAMLHYDLTARCRLQINAANLFDKRYLAAINTINWAYYGNPRVVTASMTYKY
ncbi:MAG: TonB-dependent siderophore receptor [Opitutaceae bacterium]|jgi:iron complex outermembrane receptor protein|nr:TonB-dependent siderophore receptor [Opitutaceae bacterium]